MTSELADPSDPFEDEELVFESDEDEETEAMEETTTLLVFGEEGFFDLN